METTIYSVAGKKVGSIKLPENFFGLDWNADLMHEVVVATQANRRPSVAHARDRSEVAGGGQKPWRQKGTGRARHGSTRSPIWIGGGVAHGPTNEKDYTKKVNKKARRAALFMALSQKQRDGQLIAIDSLEGVDKTKSAREALKQLAETLKNEELATREKNAVLVAVSKKNSPADKSFRNLPGISVSEIRNLNPYDVLLYRYLVVENPQALIDSLEAKVK